MLKTEDDLLFFTETVLSEIYSSWHLFQAMIFWRKRGAMGSVDLLLL